MSPIKVRPCDDKLAHGIVRSAGIASNDSAAQLIRRLSKANHMTDFIRECVGHFGRRIVAAKCSQKLTGSRAKCCMVILEPNDDGDYRAMMLGWDGGARPYRTYLKAYGIVVERHCLARFIQRTSGISDVEGAIEAIRPYLLHALDAARGAPEGGSTSISGPLGEMRCRTIGGELRCKTWIGAERATPQLEVTAA